MRLSFCIRIVYFMLYFQLHADSVWNINLQKKQQTITNIVAKRANGKNGVTKNNNKKITVLINISCKQCIPRSDCSKRSSLIRDCTVCQWFSSYIKYPLVGKWTYLSWEIEELLQ